MFMKKHLALLLLLPLPALAQSLTTVIVQPHSVALTFPTDGVVEAQQQAIVAAQIAGRIVEVRADAGQVVRKGDVLMRIDAREASEAAAAAEAQYRNARLNYERSQQLVARKFLSPAALDKARSDLDAAAAQRASAGAAQSHATIVAPTAGVVARRHSELGEMAAPGKPLFTIYEPGGLRVTAQVPQYKLAELRGNKVARIEFTDSGRWVDAASVTVLPTVDANTHSAEARALLPAKLEPPLMLTPGMFARVHFVVGRAEKMTVPTAAIVRRGEVGAVYVQAENGRLSLRQLRLGEKLGEGETEVLAGLSAGEKVVTDPVKAAIALKSGK